MTDHPPAAILGATRAAAACNVGWKTAIDDPATVARAALDAAAPHLAAAERERACYIAGAYLDGNVLREFAGEIGCELIRQEAP